MDFDGNEDFGHFGDEVGLFHEDDSYELDRPLDYTDRMEAEQDAFEDEMERRYDEYRDEQLVERLG